MDAVRLEGVLLCATHAYVRTGLERVSANDAHMQSLAKRRSRQAGTWHEAENHQTCKPQSACGRQTSMPRVKHCASEFNTTVQAWISSARELHVQARLPPSAFPITDYSKRARWLSHSEPVSMITNTVGKCFVSYEDAQHTDI